MTPRTRILYPMYAQYERALQIIEFVQSSYINVRIPYNIYPRYGRNGQTSRKQPISVIKLHTVNTYNNNSRNFYVSSSAAVYVSAEPNRR